MLDPRNLLDVLAAAGAARASRGRFSFARDAQQMPAVSAEQADALVAELRAADFAPLANGDMDLLRGSGHMPTLDVRARKIAERVTAADIVAWRDPPPSRRGEHSPWVQNLSLRWEVGHASDQPAALRWGGSKPVPRLSHLGRNALALAVVVLDAPNFVVPPYGTAWRPRHEWPVMTLRRCWFVPHEPMSYAAWKALQAAGPPTDDLAYMSSSPTPAIMSAGQWHFARIASAGYVLHLAYAETPASAAP
jgi:hypothetical protein